MIDKVSLAKEIIERNIAARISLKDISSRVFLSPRHFQRLFKKKEGITLFQYIERKRLERSLLLLQDVGMQIADIAMAVGYDNYETFSVRFKKQFKISPGDLKSVLDNIRKQTGVTQLYFEIDSAEKKDMGELLNKVKAKGKSKDSVSFIVEQDPTARPSARSKSKYLLRKYECE
jgi:AraC-like DNA-binding protein